MYVEQIRDAARIRFALHRTLYLHEGLFLGSCTLSFVNSVDVVIFATGTVPLTTKTPREI